MQKLTVKDIAKFTIIHTAELKSYLNKPTVDHEKACARLLLHKALQDKYEFLRNRFASIPIDDLLMSREERRRIKKDEKEKKKQHTKQNVNVEGNWSIEDVSVDEISSITPGLGNMDDPVISENEFSKSETERAETEYAQTIVNVEQESHSDNSNSSDNRHDELESEMIEIADENKMKQEIEVCNNESSNAVNRQVKEKITSENTCTNNIKTKQKSNKEIKPKKNKETIKNNTNKFKEKMLSKKLNRDLELTQPKQERIADPFFVTSTGESYMSLVETRQPDEIKEVHKQGNRKLRRAIMFGHTPKFQFRQNKNKTDRPNGEQTNRSDWSKDDRRQNFKEKRDLKEAIKKDVPEKLHPSWEAKKRQSGILPFEGKKIIFD